MGMLIKLVVGIVFQNQPTLRPEQAVLEDQAGDGIQFGQTVRRSGKNVVEVFRAMLNVLEHIGFYDADTVFDAQFSRRLANKSYGAGEFIYVGHIHTAREMNS